ncbi:MAG: glycerol-3-phosphate dehydrogenase/oxidase [Marinomonas sp.]
MVNNSNSAISFTDRTDFLAQLRQHSTKTTRKTWDVIVIGGGIVGAGVLQEARRRGLSALLIEQQDFAWGTSSRSSKMVHGGLRYIAQGDIKLTKQALQERERLLKEAPGLIERMGYYFVLKQGQIPGRFIMNTLLWLYDWLAGIKDHRFFNVSQTIKKFPGLSCQTLKGSCYYTDSTVDDSRLVMRVLQESINAGAQAINYIKATSLVKNPHTQQVIGVNIQDNSPHAPSTEILTLQSKVVINATGAWADKLRNEVVTEQRVRPLRGSHVVVAKATLPVNSALTLLHSADKRPVFIYPWEGATIIGTTDLDHQDDLDNEAKISQEELDYLLAVVNENFAQYQITHHDIISTFSGVRPVISCDRHFAKQASKERRDHAIWAESGLVTASGGKLTTFRLTAIEALDAAMPWLTSETKNQQEHQQSEQSHVFSNLAVEQLFPSKHQHNIAWLARLVGRYGNNAPLILSNTSQAETKLIENTQFCLAECRWAIKHEAVVHLDDLLLRRTRLGLLVKNAGESLFNQLAVIFQQELGWSETKWQDELTRYQAIIKQYYYLPMSLDLKPNTSS